MNNIENLQKMYPYVLPSEPVDPDRHGWFEKSKQVAMDKLIPDSIDVVLELGSWLGSSSRFWAERSNVVICIDTWKGSIEHHQPNRNDVKDKLRTLYETFLVNCKEYADKIIPIRNTSLDGMDIVSQYIHEVDVVFVDASHQYEDVYADIRKAKELFDCKMIVGDDWTWQNKSQNKRCTVKEAVQKVVEEDGCDITVDGHCWRLIWK